MSNTLHFEKRDLVNLLTCLRITDLQIRDQQIQTIEAGDQMGADVSPLDEYYSKRLQLIEKNKKNIQWLITKIDEVKEETLSGDVVAVLSVIDRKN